MSASPLPLPRSTPIHAVGRLVLELVTLVGDITLFSLQTLSWTPIRLPKAYIFWPILYEIGVRSIPVIIVTGSFVGMVLSVQTYDQFAMMHMENQLGAVVNVTLVKELGPVLAALMLAGRVGCAIAAELGTMRVTEQIDALSALGANPVAHLVVPRFLACLLLIPLLTVFADGVGVIAGWFYSCEILGIDSFFYWHHSYRFVAAWDVWTGIVKSIFFGSAISLIACHRGFHSRAGAEGVGRAATEAFVYSFVAILIIDFLLGTLGMEVYEMVWGPPSLS